MSIVLQLKQYATEIASQKEAQASNLEKEQDDLKARIAELEIKSHSARLAFKRLSDFQAAIGPDYQCPRCWIENENRFTLFPVGSSTVNNTFSCRGCGSQFDIKP